jgi:hypothetical protein
MALDSLSMVMFAVVFVSGFVFFVMSLAETRRNEKGEVNFIAGLISSVIAFTSWMVFGLVWPAFATQDAFIPISYLWFGLAVVSGILAVFFGVQPIFALQHAKEPRRMVLQENRDED